MRREVPEEDLRRLYRSCDMVKADCGGCKGCSDCCRGMGNSVVLDPWDVYWLSRGLNSSFSVLLNEYVELNVVDGLVLPNLKMTGEEERCRFLDAEGRCRVHGFRPGICRLFPLGRYYENREFRYFLQSRECKKENRTKVKISKWLGIPDLKRYEEFVLQWHDFLDEVMELLDKQKDNQLSKDLGTYLLNTFYGEPYDLKADFYGQFEERLTRTKKLLLVLGRN